MSSDADEILARVEYAGFWRRFVAYVIDSILIGVVIGILAAILSGSDTGVALTYLIGALGGLVYYAAMESSAYQATVGKIALGIQVTDLEGNRVSFLRALGRNLAKILSAIILYIGFIMAAFTARKQALHDMIASTLVVKKGTAAPAPPDTTTAPPPESTL
jgi:uncharacterized RDD family membrane protein YckC